MIRSVEKVTDLSLSPARLLGSVPMSDYLSILAWDGGRFTT